MSNQIEIFMLRPGPLLGLATILSLWLFYRISHRWLHGFLSSRAYKSDNVNQFLFAYRYTFIAIGFLLAVVSFSGSLAHLGLSAAFLGMVLGWSLQSPVTGIAGWLMIILKQPFKIGDRVIIAGIVGDVVDITLMHVVLDQVGGTVVGEEATGRMVFVPNATLFSQIIYNYTFKGNPSDKTASYLLDEVTLRVPFTADMEEAEAILIRAAKNATAAIIKENKLSPFVRQELFESGVLMRLRYMTHAKERQRISTEVVRSIVSQIKTSEKVDFCYQHIDILHQPRKLQNVY